MIRVLLVDDQALVRSGFRIILESEPDIQVVGEAADGAEAVELAARHSPDVICMDVEMPGVDGITASREILGASRPGAAAHSASGSGSGSTPAVLILTTFGHETYLFDALAAGVSGFLLKTSRAEQLIDAVRSLAAGDALLGPDVTRAVIERIAADRDAATGEPRDSAPDRAAAAAGSPAAQAPGAPGSQAPTPAAPGAAAAPAASAAPRASAAPGAFADPRSAAPEAFAHGSGSQGTAPGSGSTEQAAGARSADARAVFDSVGLTERERDVLRLLADGLNNAEIAAALFLGEATIKTHVSNLLQKLGARDRIQAVVWAHTNGAV